MASWKKVVVSGSAISQLNNDANYLIDAQSSAVLTGSFTGSFVGDGSGLTGVTADGTLSSSAQIASDISGAFVSDSASIASDIASINALTLVTGSAQIDHDATTNFVANEHIDHTSVSITAGDGLSGGGTIASTRTISINTGSAHFEGGVKTKLNAESVLSSSLQIAGDISGSLTSLSSSVASDIAGLVTDSGSFSTRVTALEDFSSSLGADFVDNTELNSATSSLSASLAADIATNDSRLDDLEADALISGATFSSPSQGTVRATINGVNTDIDTGLQAGDNVTFADVTITGDLTTQGTVTNINTTDLNIEDKFILVNSGSSTGNAGLIAQNSSTNGQGTALFWDDTENRWSLDHAGADATGDTATADARIAAVALSITDTNYQKNGNIFVSGSGDVYIYVE